MANRTDVIHDQDDVEGHIDCSTVRIDIPERVVSDVGISIPLLRIDNRFFYV